MLKLQAYLLAHKEKHILKISLYLISILIIYLSLWAWPWLTETLLLRWHHKLLMSLMALMILWIVILHSYIKYSYKENDLKFKIEKYDNDKEYGYLIHRVTKDFYCTKCLYNEPHNEVPLTQNGDNNWICKVCKEPYFKSTQHSVSIMSSNGKSKFRRELDEF